MDVACTGSDGVNESGTGTACNKPGNCDSEQVDPSSAEIKSDKTQKHKEPKLCRYLSTAIRLSHSKSVLVLADKSALEKFTNVKTIHEDETSSPKQPMTVDEFGRCLETKKRPRENECDKTTDNKVPRNSISTGGEHYSEHKDTIHVPPEAKISIRKFAGKRKNKKKKTMILTTSYLPGASSLPDSVSTIALGGRNYNFDGRSIDPGSHKNVVLLQESEMMQLPTKHVNIYVKPLIVLDVNGILCHRIRIRDNSNIPEQLLELLLSNYGNDMPLQEGQGRGQVDEIITSKFKYQWQWKKYYRRSIGHIAFTDIVQRTDLRYFLTYLSEHFTLAVWSSAKKKTLRYLIQKLIPPEVSERLLFVWGQERCDYVKVDVKQGGETNSNTNNIGAHEKGATRKHDHSKDNGVGSSSGSKSYTKDFVFMKHLSKVWQEYPLWNASNTILMDDSPEKCLRFRDNCIHPPPIMGINMAQFQKFLKELDVNKDDSVESNKSIIGSNEGTPVFKEGNCTNESSSDIESKKDGIERLESSNSTSHSCAPSTSSSATSSTSTSSIEDLMSDEENESKQMEFFQKLAKVWRQTSLADDDEEELLFNFLKVHGKDHMNWRCDLPYE